MKKLSLFIAAMVCVSAAAGCGINDESEEYASCKTLYLAEQSSSEQDKLEFSEDMDGDGEKEDIEIEYGEDRYNNISASLKVGDAEIDDIFDDSYVYGIIAVYLMDLDPDDDAGELGIVSYSDNDWCDLAVIRYEDDSLSTLQFCSKSRDGSRNKTAHLMLCSGFDESYVDVSRGGSLQLVLRTRSRGMWNVKTTWNADKDGIYEMKEQDKYDVVPKSGIMADDEGYWDVNEDIEGRGFDLEEGDRIRVIADDMDNHIVIEKDTGEKGEFEMYGYSDDELYDVSDMFMLAG